jgi:hypothetical protein
MSSFYRNTTHHIQNSILFNLRCGHSCDKNHVCKTYAKLGEYRRIFKTLNTESFFADIFMRYVQKVRFAKHVTFALIKHFIFLYKVALVVKGNMQ